MKTVYIQVEDDFVDELIKMLPTDKVIVLNDNFKENKDVLHESLQDYKDKPEGFIPYYESMTHLDNWLQEKGE